MSEKQQSRCDAARPSPPVPPLLPPQRRHCRLFSVLTDDDKNSAGSAAIATTSSSPPTTRHHLRVGSGGEMPRRDGRRLCCALPQPSGRCVVALPRRRRRRPPRRAAAADHDVRPKGGRHGYPHPRRRLTVGTSAAIGGGEPLPPSASPKAFALRRDVEASSFFSARYAHYHRHALPTTAALCPPPPPPSWMSWAVPHRCVSRSSSLRARGRGNVEEEKFSFLAVCKAMGPR